MCATCVAQGAAYLLPAYAGLKAYGWRRQRATKEHPTGEREAPARRSEPPVTA
jgi:hypothetical protein